MSNASRTSLDIFKAIMDHGPLTLYSANSKTTIPIGTVHRHFKHLSAAGKIRVYRSNRKGRKKIEYGPTIHGIVDIYRQDRGFAKKIENYFLIWIEHKEFQKDLALEGFDISVEGLQKSRHVFRKYVEYFSAIEEQMDKIKNGDDSVSRDIKVFFSSMMLFSNPYYQKLWEELYDHLPGTQKSIDEYMEAMLKSYKEFKKNRKK